MIKVLLKREGQFLRPHLDGIVEKDNQKVGEGLAFCLKQFSVFFSLLVGHTYFFLCS